MEKLELIKNGIPSAIASVDYIGGSEHVVIGDYQKNLVFRTKGSVRIQVNNKFYDLLDPSEQNTSSDPLNTLKIIEGGLSTLTETPLDGSLIYSKSSNGFYLIIDGEAKRLNATDSVETGSGVVSDVVHINDSQILNSTQMTIVQSNIGVSYTTLENFSLIPWENKAAYIEVEGKHYIYKNNKVLPLYVTHEKGGIVRNGLTISETVDLYETPLALLHVQSNSNLLISEKYSGFFVGNKDLSMGLGIHLDEEKAESFVLLRSPLNVLNSDNEESIRIEKDAIYIGGINGNHLLSAKGVTSTEYLNFSETLYVKDTKVVEPYSYFDEDRTSGFSIRKHEKHWILQVDRLITTAKEEIRSLSGTGQIVIGDRVRILNTEYTSETELYISTDEMQGLAVNDLLLGIATNEDNRVVGLMSGKVTAVQAPASTAEYRAMQIDLENSIGIDENLGHSYMDIVKINKAGVLLDGKTNSVIGYNPLTSVLPNLNLTTVQDIQTAIDNKGFLYLKPLATSIHTVIGDLTNRPDTAFGVLTGFGLYSNNAYIKGSAELSYLLAVNDIEIKEASKGVILKSPNGTRYRVQISDSGTLTTTAL